MTAVVPTTVQVLSARVDKSYGTAEVKTQLVFVSATSTATSNTIDLSTYCDLSGILGVLINAVDGATSTTSPTWSGTTVTLAQHAGSGVCKMLFLVY